MQKNNLPEESKFPQPPAIPVYVADEDVEKFIVFQQYYEPFQIMLKHGVFGQKNATVLLDFDKMGVLRSIRRNDFLYTTKG